MGPNRLCKKPSKTLLGRGQRWGDELASFWFCFAGGKNLEPEVCVKAEKEKARGERAELALRDAKLSRKGNYELNFWTFKARSEQGGTLTTRLSCGQRGFWLVRGPYPAPRPGSSTKPDPPLIELHQNN